MRNVLLQMAFYIRPTGTQISRGFKVHNVITCESKVQVVVLLNKGVIEFWPMARDTFSSNQETYLSWKV